MPDPALMRLSFRHLCGATIYGEPVQNKLGPYSHYVFYTKRKNGVIAQLCPECRGRIGATSVKTEAEYERAQIAAETLELELDRQRQITEEAAEAEEHEGGTDA